MPVKRSASPRAETAPGIRRAGSVLEAAALMLLLLVVAMRPLISETYDSALQPIAVAAGGPSGANPATSLWFDLAIWAAALAGLGASLLGGRAWRWTGAEAGWLLMVAAATISTLGASNRRLAVNASADWLTAGVLLFALFNLCRQRWQIKLLLAVMVASGAASAAKSAMQIGWEYDETREVYQQGREEFWARQGVRLDDPRVELFERRMHSNQASGFFPHSNSEAALLSLAGFAAFALAAGGSRPAARLAVRMVGLALLAMVLATRSKGGIAAATAGGVVYLLLAYAGPRLRRNWRATLAAAWGLALAGALAVVLLGAVRGGLPGSSLGFRWQYWLVTKDIIGQQLWSGTGALNFDRAYLMHKPIEYPEEIKDPHNFVLSAAAQWGILGAVGLLAALAGFSVVLARAWGRERPGGGAPGGAFPVRWVTATAIGVILLRLWLLRDYVISRQVGEQAMAFFDLGTFGLLWLVTFAGVLWAVRPSRGGDCAAVPCLCGCVAFLLHNTIEFSIFYPGTLTVFVAMAAALLAETRADEAESAPDRRTALAALVAVGGTAAFLAVAFVPVVRASASLERARELAAISPKAADQHYAAAAAADRLDPTPLLERAVLRASPGPEQDFDVAVRAIWDAVTRDRYDTGIYHVKSRVIEARYRATGSTADLSGAIGALRQAVSLYPQSPEEHLSLAELLGRLAAQVGSPELASEAIEEYCEALRLNAARPGTDEVRRWSPQYVSRLETHVRALQQLQTRPASEFEGREDRDAD